MGRDVCDDAAVFTECELTEFVVVTRLYCPASGRVAKEVIEASSKIQREPPEVCRYAQVGKLLLIFQRFINDAALFIYSFLFVCLQSPVWPEPQF